MAKPPDKQRIASPSLGLITAQQTPTPTNDLRRRPTYYDDPKYKARVASFLRRKTRNRTNFFARSYTGELFVVRALIVFYQTLGIYKTATTGMTAKLLTLLLMAKLFCTHHGVEHFSATELRTFTNHVFYRTRSFQHSFSGCQALSDWGYLNPLRPDDKPHQVRWILSMKARTLFNDLDKEFAKPFVISSPIRKSQA